jgi:hypothetical protein
VGKEVLKENLEREKSLSQILAWTKKTLLVSNDARWDIQSALRPSDSLSGCSGNRSGLIIRLVPMFMCSISYEKNIPQNPNLCSYNYEGSWKGMEVAGAVNSVVFKVSQDDMAYFGNSISDDYASLRVVLQHSVEEMINSGRMKEEDWPRYKGKGCGKKPDNGQLPIHHPKINFPAVKEHRVRGYVKKYFALAGLCKENNLGCTKLDIKQMKPPTLWALRIATM